MNGESIPDTERPPPPARPSVIVDVVPLQLDDLRRRIDVHGVDAYARAMLQGLGYVQVCPGRWIPGERSGVRS